MAASGKESKKNQKRSVVQKLRTVIISLAIVVAAIAAGGVYIVSQQDSGTMIRPLQYVRDKLSRAEQKDKPAATAAAEPNQTQAAKQPGVVVENTEAGTAEEPENTAAGAAEDAVSEAHNTEQPTAVSLAEEAEAEMQGDEEVGSVGTAAHDPDVVVYDGKQYVYNDHLSNYLMLGVDTSGDIQVEKRSVSGGQSDAMYLVSYDRKEETVQILAIPRDTMTEIQLYDENGTYLGATVNHITLQYAYGDGKRKSCELACDAVSHLLYELPILGYASINTDSIPLLADVVGGVPLTVADNSLQDVLPEFTRGNEVVVTTENAEKYLRYRDTHQHQQALVRMDRQKVFIKAFIKKLKELQRENPHTITDVYETLKPHMVTNMTNDVFLDLATARQDSKIETVPGMGVNTDLYDEYHVDESALYRLILEMFYKEVEE